MEGVVGLFSWCCFVQGKGCTWPLSAEMGILSPWWTCSTASFLLPEIVWAEDVDSFSLMEGS